MITKKFGWWCLAGATISSCILGAWWAPFCFLTWVLYDAIKPEDKKMCTCVECQGYLPEPEVREIDGKFAVFYMNEQIGDFYDTEDAAWDSIGV